MKELSTIFKNITKELEPIFWDRYSDDNILSCHITSAYSKCFEFNVLVNRNNSITSSFFFSPALRGICEDIIVLKFLKKQSKLNPNIIIKNFMMIQLMDTSDKQKSFFKKNNPQQIVFEYPESEKVRNENINMIKLEWAKIGANKDKIFPSTAQMAVDSGLVELYDYLYSATSSMVHFSPHVLMRSGWSKKNDKDFHEFSTRNFYKYYNLFNKFYGTYLFILFTESFKKDLAIPKNVLKEVKKMKEIIFDESRWPELITFEEMNVPEAKQIRMINAIRKLSSNIKKRTK